MKAKTFTRAQEINENLRQANELLEWLKNKNDWTIPRLKKAVPDLDAQIEEYIKKQHKEFEEL